MSKEDVNMRYRKLDELYELHDGETNKSYWIKKYKNGRIEFRFRTEYPD